MSIAKHWLHRAVITTGLAGLVAIAGLGALVIGASSSTVWLDAPLDESVVPLENAVSVVGHVSDSGAVTVARLDVDGVTTAEANLDSSPGQLTTVQFSWQPPSPGTHILALWASDATGDWAGPAIATITVAGAVATTTLTVPPTTTTLPAPTTTAPPVTTTTTPPATTTTTTCEFDAPEPLAPADGSVSSLPFVPLSWGYHGCRLSIEFDVEVSNTPSFIEVVASSSIPASSVSGGEWTTPALGCDTYWWRVRPRTHDATGPWSTPWSLTVTLRGCP